MSTITEHAELEAAIAEAGLTDEEAELVKQLVEREELAVGEAVQAALDTRSEETPEEPADGEQGEPSDKQLAQLDRENERHERRVREVMASFVDGFVTCETCSGVGLVPPGPPAPELQAHPFFKRCETCEGFGKVLTGSLDPNHSSRPCPGCKGRGYLEALGEGGAPLADGGTIAPAAPPPPVTVAQGNEQTPPQRVPGELSFGVPAWMGDPSIGG